MTDMLTTAALIERLDTMDAEELDRLQAAIDRRRSQLDGRGSGTDYRTLKHRRQRRAYGSGVLQLEKRVRVDRTGTSTTARTASKRPFISARRTPPRSSWRR